MHLFYFMFKNINTVLLTWIFCSQDQSLELLRRFSIGLCSGILGSVINIPFDVAKSRIQGPQPVPGQIKYRTCFATIVTVYKEEGYVFWTYGGVQAVELLESSLL